MAAIASLAPTNGHAIESVQPGIHGSNGTGHEVPASAYGSAVAAEVSGPRWMAQPVEVALEESKLVLDQEMQLAHAARASAEAASFSAAIAAASASSVAIVEPEPAVAAEASATESATATQSVPAVIEASVGESGASESAIVEASTVQDHEPAVAEESAYAAAASAGAVAEHAAPTEAVSATTTAAQINAIAQAESAPQREAELAAAWQNWKQIRESFVGSEPPAATADAPAELNSNHEEAAAPAQSASAEVVAESVEVEGAASDAPEESTAIASIVDSMLAELRPKLVEEIAKKMNSEKKEKDKKKKK
jgi:epidermal growth factor receptor substrate 15